MAKKYKKPEEMGECAPMWIVSFADLVTLMMSFFVVLYALKKGGSSESEAAVTEAIINQFQGDMPSDPDNPLNRARRIRLGLEAPTKESGNSDDTAKGVEGRHAEVQSISARQATPTAGGSILFGFGKSDLTPDAKEIVSKLFPILTGHKAVLLVKGHVSGDEIADRPDDPYGTSLSQRRANAVAEELIRLGIDRRLLRPTACGPYEPVKSGSYTPEDLSNNRRVEVFSTDKFISDYNPTATVHVDVKTPEPQEKVGPTTKPASHGARTARFA